MNEHYIHGYSADEQQRLTLMQSLLNQAQIDAMDLRSVNRLLDVGCGLGQLTRALARRLKSCAVVIGIEWNEVQLAEARRQAAADNDSQLVEFRQGDATNLPLEPHERGSFDLVHARFLLEHVRQPLPVVQEMVQAARRGGQVVLIDDDHDLLRIWPDCEPVQRAWEVYWKSYYDLGLDPLVGRKLGELLYQAGATEIRTNTVFYGAHAGAELFGPVVDNLIGVLESAEKMLAEKSLLSRDEMRNALGALDEWRREPSACLWYSLPMATGIRTL